MLTERENMNLRIYSCINKFSYASKQFYLRNWKLTHSLKQIYGLRKLINKQ